MKNNKFYLGILFGIVVILLVACGKSTSATQPTVIPLPPIASPTSTSSPCAGPPDASAFDMVFMIQNDSFGEYLADSGLLIHTGDTFSNDDNGEYPHAGFWKGYKDQEFTVNFSDINGEPYAQMGLKGELRWDETQCIYKGMDSFKWIQVQTGTRSNITKSEIEQGHLVLTDDEGNKYTVLHFGPTFNGVMEKQ